MSDLLRKYGKKYLKFLYNTLYRKGIKRSLELPSTIFLHPVRLL